MTNLKPIATNVVTDAKVGRVQSGNVSVPQIGGSYGRKERIFLQ